MNNTNNDNDNITQLTSELMEHYAQGKLSPKQMHAVEKYLLDNPFEAEAMEGVSSSPNDFSNDVKTLQSKIQDRVKEKSKKVIPIWKRYYGIAAAIALIIVGSFVIVNLFENKEENNEQLALKNQLEVEEMTPTEKEKDVERTVEEEIDGQDESIVRDDHLNDEKTVYQSEKTEQVIEKIQRDKEELMPVEKKNSYKSKVEDAELRMDVSEKTNNEANEITIAQAYMFEEEIEIPEELKRKRNDLVQDNETEIPNLEELDVAKSLAGKVAGVETKKSKTNALSKRARQPSEPVRAESFVATKVDSNTRTIRGTITSIEDGMPLPGVNVVIKGTTTGTISDIDGNYEITINEGDLLTYSFVGLVSEELESGERYVIDLAMYADVAQLSEVVVTAQGITREKQSLGYSVAKIESSDKTSSRPKIGYYSYRKYLKDNLIYPQQALDSAVKGRVTVIFTVSDSGILKNFKIKKGIGYGCDEEAIRLIKEGPNWEAATENNIPIESEVRIRVKFEG